MPGPKYCLSFVCSIPSPYSFDPPTPTLGIKTGIFYTQLRPSWVQCEIPSSRLRSRSQPGPRVGRCSASQRAPLGLRCRKTEGVSPEGLESLSQAPVPGASGQSRSTTSSFPSLSPIFRSNQRGHQSRSLSLSEATRGSMGAKAECVGQLPTDRISKV